jgi:hypothetical protein
MKAYRPWRVLIPLVHLVVLRNIEGCCVVVDTVLLVYNTGAYGREVVK